MACKFILQLVDSLLLICDCILESLDAGGTPVCKLFVGYSLFLTFGYAFRFEFFDELNHPHNRMILVQSRIRFSSERPDDRKKKRHGDELHLLAPLAVQRLVVATCKCEKPREPKS